MQLAVEKRIASAVRE